VEGHVQQKIKKNILIDVIINEKSESRRTRKIVCKKE
jgi:ribosome-associated protein YbcJ (S4-like RNA binding protein)